MINTIQDAVNTGKAYRDYFNKKLKLSELR
jgi:hypothetical protein